ncbi:MAG: KH domain-containing protein [Chloroflexi bacterium]|nr:KH domain-containing protein [Chloroflexota bacterium]
MKALVEYIAKALVENPDAVVVKARRSGHHVYVDISAASNDIGRLIGRHGRTAQAIRSVARVAAHRQGLRVTVDID